jgi:hypothetical protein
MSKEISFLKINAQTKVWLGRQLPLVIDGANWYSLRKAVPSISSTGEKGI